MCKDCKTSDIEQDHRRIRMRSLVRQEEGMVEFVMDTEASRRGFDLILDLLELYDEEGLLSRSFREQACYNAFQLALKCDDLTEADKWIRQAYLHAMVCRGKDHPETRQLKEYVLEPRSHPICQSKEMTESVGSGAAIVAMIVILWFL